MESVWDYPRPPAVEPCTRRVRIELDGEVIADSTRALRVLETSHPPAIYVPEADIRPGVLVPVGRTTVCEFKGRARYFDVGSRPAAAWTYPDPDPRYAALAGHVSFYPGRPSEAVTSEARQIACWLGDERVQAQPGDFYGGWITADVIGPFKGGAGTLGW
jgi:uncharacterized protein (DUF427 family)